jgi:hypothetical protein
MSHREIPQDDLIVCSNSDVINSAGLVQERGPDLVETGGVGPCLGIAILIKDVACLIHINSPSATVPTATEPFFDSIRRLSTPEVRGQAFPIIFGCYAMRLGGHDEELAESADSDWHWGKEKLSKLGFAGILERRGDEKSSKTLVIDRRRGRSMLVTFWDDGPTETEYFRWNSREPAVPVD